MTYTQGGSAAPVTESTEAPVGGPAIPVAVVADGRPVTGGPAQPVYVVSAAELASGAFRLAGGPAQPVVAVTGRPVTAGRPLAVYAVSGSFDPGPVLVPGGLVAAYQFTEASGTSLTDYSGNGHTGTLAGTTPPQFVGSPPQALFNGNLSRVALPDLSAAGGSITVHVTFRPDVIDGTTDTIVRYLSYGVAPFSSVMIFVAGGNIRYLLGFSDNSFANTVIQAGTVGTWYDVALTYNGATCVTYVNGVQVTSTNHNKPLKTAASLSFIGSSTAATEFFVGSVVALQLYSRVLAPAEVTNNSTVNRARIPPGVNPNLVTSTNAASAQITPTYDGSGETTHPDVLDFGGSWNDYRYWLAHTPYPASDEQYENPSILASSDGTAWETPPGLTNPIDPRPPANHNADADLVYDPATGTLYCYWESTDAGCCVKSSTDGVTWGNEQQGLTGTTIDLSPSVVRGPDGLYHMWGVKSADNTLQYMRSASPDSGWASVAQCVMRTTALAVPVLWHCNVTWSPLHNEWHGWFTISSVGAYRLFFATSANGVTWVVSRIAQLNPSAIAWDNAWVYRASAVLTSATTYDLWYSGKSSGGAWHIGRTTVTLP